MVACRMYNSIISNITRSHQDHTSWYATVVFLSEQEVQLSQRDRMTLRIIEYFAKSLKVTHGH